MSGVDVVVVVALALSEPLVLAVIVAGLVKRGVLTAHLHKPPKLPTDPLD